MARFARLAPGLDLDIAQPAGDNVRRSPTAPWTWPWACSTRCPPACTGVRCTNRLACVLRAGHPDAAALDLDGYLALRHIAVTISGVGASPWTRPCRRAA